MQRSNDAIAESDRATESSQHSTEGARVVMASPARVILTSGSRSAVAIPPVKISIRV